MNKKELWLKLRDYHFDHLVPPHMLDHIRERFGGTNAFVKAFASKMARKLGWSTKFALIAINEYKKFIYLGVISDFNVTPSKAIDQVWHEHLLFTRAYRDFCKEVIDYEFDHNPELIPMMEETATFNVQYLDTLALYKEEFGVDPPDLIWAVSKFDKKAVATDGYRSRKKKKNGDSFYDGNADDTPLHSYFDSDGHSYSEFSGFDGGDFGGAGASDSWDSGGYASADSSSSDGGSSCSSCSSGCGGGD